ncbi:TatD DNase family protein [Desulfuromusa kysingii]|uniref:TatD DNase family protein n=1 Tax=Desulfuromusa kysingii TaxID=37625 RepID=A0A1H3VJ09_9BACT|nr:TatD family hydrolase [Desulfuromusa kysingii]SDZ74759.1 TatD DNase family protein [Desulfuromusa kysingii]
MNDWFDTHIHLLAPEWRQRPEELYQQISALGVGKMVMPGVRVADWPALLALAQHLPAVYFAPGLHPVYADQWNANAAEQLKRLAGMEKVVAIGEIGLDAVAGPSLDEQELVFRSQLQIALDCNLPVLLHSRNTTGRVLAVLRELNVGQQVGGIWHGFSGSIQVANELVCLGFKIGVGPILLRKSARKLPLAVVNLPEDALVLETDAPDMIAEVDGLLHVAQRLAELKGWNLERVAKMTYENATRVFSRIQC